MRLGSERSARTRPFRWMAALGAALVVGGCAGGGGGKTVHIAEIAGKHVALSTPSGRLASGENKLTVSVTDPSGQPVDVQGSRVRFFMPAMPNMPEMSAEASLQRSKPGVFQGTVDLPMKGTWQTTVTFTDAAGSHQATFSLQAE